MGRTRASTFSPLRALIFLALLLNTAIGVAASPAASERNTAAPSVGTAGSLDTSFSRDGKRAVWVPKGGHTYEKHYSVAVQADGKIVLAGTLFTGGVSSEIFVIRLRAGGRLDRTFSGDGVRRLNLTAGHDRAHDVVIQPDGKIVLAGAISCPYPPCYNHFLVVRLLPNGGRDRRFGSRGIVDIDFRWTLNDVALAADLDRRGRIVVAGSSDSEHHMAVARLRPNGSLDPRFSGDGRALIRGDERDLIVQAVAVDSTGGVITAGNDFAAARLSPAGRLDRSFGTDGFVGLSEFIAYDIDIKRDGRIISMGENEDPVRMSAMRLHPDGSLDATYGSGGVGMFEAANTYGGVVHRGKAVLVGPTTFNEGDDQTDGFGVVRLSRNGQPDTSFGEAGMARTPFVDDGVPRDVAIGPGSRIVVVGTYALSDRLLVVRYLWE